MLMFVEACHSGSMFEGHLTSDIGVFAMTSGNKHGCGHACCYDENRKAFVGKIILCIESVTITHLQYT